MLTPEERRLRNGLYVICGIRLALVLFDYWQPHQWDYCGSEDHGPCIRDWLFMMSGWGTVIGGGAAAYYVYHSLEETRRQTAFIVGDERPTAEILAGTVNDAAAIRIVNWNRRPFVVNRVIWTCDVQVSGYDHFVVERNGVPISHRVRPGGFFVAPVTIPGFENRSEAPHSVIIKPAFYIPDDVSFRHDQLDGDFVALAIGVLLGTKPTPKYTRAIGQLRQIVPTLFEHFAEKDQDDGE